MVAQETGVYIPPQLPLDSARHAPGTVRGYKLSCFDAGRIMNMNRPNCRSTWWGPYRAGAAPEGAALSRLVLFFTRFLASSLASKRGFYALLLAGLQVKGVALDLLDYVFLLHLALKASQSVLEGFSLLKPYFCQTDTPPNPSGRTE